MEHRLQQPPRRPVTSDPHLTLMAGDDGIGFVHCGDGVLVVPLTEDGQVLLAVERAAAFGRDELGLVSGAVEEGESLAETANRELQEELGRLAGRLDLLGELHPFKYLASCQFVFRARDLERNCLKGDELYPISALPVALDRALDLCAGGELHDAATVAALCLAQRFRRHEAREAGIGGAHP